jgi:ribonuclease VapC
MIFVDASALCAVLLGEDDGEALAMRIAESDAPLMSPIAVFETVLAHARSLDGDVAAARRDVDRFVKDAGVRIVEIGQAEQLAAIDAYDRFGKGRHPARLNMGDCFAYACARVHGVPLLFKGDDFSRTDIAAAR